MARSEGGPPRWPHDRYTERLRSLPESATPRLRAIQAKASRLQRAVEGLLRGPGSPADGPLILVVEDDSAARNSVVALFARRGWRVVVAGTVADGLTGLEATPDCLLLDLMLPDGDGESILRAARLAGLAARVVIVTGIDDSGRLEALARLGFDSLLQKPVTLDELCRACSGQAG